MGSHLGFICTEGAGVNSTLIPRLEAEHLKPRWSTIPQSATSWRSYGKKKQTKISISPRIIWKADFHIILAKLERCTCRRCLRAWGVKEQKDKECRKGQKKKNAVHFLPHPSPCFSFALLLYTPVFLPCFSSSTKKNREDGYGGQPTDQQADWSIHSYWQIIKSFFPLWISSLSLRTNPSFTCLFYVSFFLTKRN